MRSLTAQIRIVAALVLGLGLAWLPAPAQPAPRGESGPARVFKAQISPHWFLENTRFWYRNDLRDGAREFVLVDAEQGVRRPAFDHERLAAALSKAAGKEFKAAHLPFTEIEFSEHGSSVRFKADEKAWVCDLTAYTCSEDEAGTAMIFPAAVPRPPVWPTEADGGFELARDNAEEPFASPDPRPQSQTAPRGSRGTGGAGGRNRAASPSVDSPDGKWTALLRGGNVYLRPAGGGDEEQFSQDGATNRAYARLEWAPDSQSFIAWRIEPGEANLVYLLESSPAGGGPAKMASRPYPQPGNRAGTATSIASLTRRWTAGTNGFG